MRGKDLLFLEEYKKRTGPGFPLQSLVRFSWPWLKILYILARENSQNHIAGSCRILARRSVSS